MSDISRDQHCKFSCLSNLVVEGGDDEYNGKVKRTFIRADGTQLGRKSTSPFVSKRSNTDELSRSAIMAANM